MLLKRLEMSGFKSFAKAVTLEFPTKITSIVGVYLNKDLVAEGEGPSKQEAQQQAAEAALKIKKWK